MDRPLDPDDIRRTKLRRIGLTVAVGVGLVAALAGATRLMRPSVARVSLRTAVVERGPVAASVSASGTVVPEVEHVLSSPIDARVVRVLRTAGAVLAKGEAIVELDSSESALALARLERSLSLKANQADRTRLQLASTLAGLDAQIEIKKLQLATFESSVARNRKLFREGLTSEEVLKQSELDEARARVELRQLDASKRIAERQTAVETEGLALETATVRQERDDARKVLDQAAARADVAGVLTFVVTEEGARVRKGDVLARVADLSTFRVDATTSDVHATRIAKGLAAEVLIGDTRLSGTVSRVHPSIQNGVMSFTVSLAEPSRTLLRPNLRVDVVVSTGGQANALRVKRGAFVNGDGTPQVFVLTGGRLVRTPIQLGVTGRDFVEVVGGLREGDEVVLSSLAGYEHLKEIRIR